MSPPRFVEPPSVTAAQAVTRVAAELGSSVREARLRRGWSVRDLADRAGVDPSEVYRLESGRVGSIGGYARLSGALGLRLEAQLDDTRRRDRASRTEDPVHSAMGDFQASHLAAVAFPVAVDEPFQHFQFAGRADLLAWSIERRALLHIENRTRFPNLQEAAGSYNAKRSYLAPVIAERLDLRGGWASVTHALVALWSSEVLHSVRLRQATFRALCPSPTDAFTAWWSGTPPTSGTSSTFILFDPLPRPPARQFVDLDAAVRVEPRYRGYADAVAAPR